MVEDLVVSYKVDDVINHLQNEYPNGTWELRFTPNFIPKEKEHAIEKGKVEEKGRFMMDDVHTYLNGIADIIEARMRTTTYEQEIDYAIEKGKVKEDRVGQHTDGDACGQAAETGHSHCDEQGGQSEEER